MAVSYLDSIHHGLLAPDKIGNLEDAKTEDGHFEAVVKDE